MGMMRFPCYQRGRVLFAFDCTLLPGFRRDVGADRLSIHCRKPLVPVQNVLRVNPPVLISRYYRVSRGPRGNYLPLKTSCLILAHLPVHRGLAGVQSLTSAALTNLRPAKGMGGRAGGGRAWRRTVVTHSESFILKFVSATLGLGCGSHCISNKPKTLNSDQLLRTHNDG